MQLKNVNQDNDEKQEETSQLIPGLPVEVKNSLLFIKTVHVCRQ